MNATQAVVDPSDRLDGRLVDVPSLQPVVRGEVVLRRSAAAPQPGVGPVQERLISLGYFIDLGEGQRWRGWFGAATEGRVLAFQADQGLPTSGAIDGALLVALDRARIDGAPWWVEPRPAVWPRVKGVPTTLLAKGAQGAEVDWLQQRLVDFGYLTPGLAIYDAPVDGRRPADWRDAPGVFGAFTELAVSSFQAWNGLTVTGTADAATREALAAVPERTDSGLARLEGGLSFEGQTEAAQLAYLRRLYDANNPAGVPFNTEPLGLNFILVRGFRDGAAVQNAPNRYDDTLFALVNDAQGAPARFEALDASADYGDQYYELQFPNMGWTRPEFGSALGPVFGPAQFLQKGVGVASAGRVTRYKIGRHWSGVSGTDRGLALIDPRDGSSGTSKVHVDYNHNGQIDGAEWRYTYFDGSINVHQGNAHPRVDEYSAGCPTLPTTGAYQRFTDLVFGSGQVQRYIERRVAAGKAREAVEAAVFGEARTDFTHPDGRPVFLGPRYALAETLEFPLALVDARAMPPFPERTAP